MEVQSRKIAKRFRRLQKSMSTNRLFFVGKKNRLKKNLKEITLAWLLHVCFLCAEVALNLLKGCCYIKRKKTNKT